MNTKPMTLGTIGYIFLFFSLLTAASTSYAQPYWQRLTDPRMVVIPTRSVQEITTDLDNAKATKQLAMNHNIQAGQRLTEIERAIQDRETTIDDINRREDDAKDRKHSDEVKSLKIESKANKQAIDLLKRLKQLREAEMDVAKEEENHADMTIRAFQMESELNTKRTEHNWQSEVIQGDLTQNTSYQVISELEVNLLKLQQELASLNQKVASKQKDVVKQRMKLHEAQFKLGM